MGSGLGTSSGERSGKSTKSARIAAAEKSALGSEEPDAVLEGELDGELLAVVVSSTPAAAEAAEAAGTGAKPHPVSRAAAVATSAEAAAARRGRNGAGRGFTVRLSVSGAGYP
ncbi:hypothetical protein GCM10025784_13220 [Citricoccus nitrophenolicus]